VKISKLEGKRVALWGWGREGRAAFAVLRERLPTLGLSLFCPAAEVEAARAETQGVLDVRGEPSAEALAAFDVVIKSPGISPYQPVALAAAGQGTTFIGGTALWFAEHAGADGIVHDTVCVTGTKGKSTTTALVAHLLRAAGHRTGLVGNIGLPLLYKIKQGKQELYLKDDPALDSYLASSAVENAALVPATGEPGIEGLALEKLLLAYAAALDSIERNAHRYDRNLLEALVDFVPMDLESLRAAGEGEGLDALAKRLNQGSLGSPRFTLELQDANDERPAAVLVTRRHMGEQHIQVLPMSAFESGELRAIHQASKLLHGLVREGATISRGAKSIEVDSFAKAQNWLLEEAKRGRQIQRFKGLGEMNPEQLWDTTVNPETRRLLQVRIEDAVAADQIFSTLMGDVVEPRRDFIEDNALKVANLDI